MNATEEYLTEAFKEQGLVIQETIEQIQSEARKIASDQSTGDEGLDFNLLLHHLNLSTEEVVNFLANE